MKHIIYLYLIQYVLQNLQLKVKESFVIERNVVLLGQKYIVDFIFNVILTFYKINIAVFFKYYNSSKNME